MRALLDTHTLLWWLNGDEKLGHQARGIIADEGNDILVSAASAWEIATKVRIGKLPGAVEVAESFDSILKQQTFQELPISTAHARHAGLMPGEHRDPFDRMLMAQSLLEDIPLISNEVLFERYGVRRIW